MNTEELAHYMELLKRVEVPVIDDYYNEAIDNLIERDDWRELVTELNKQDRRVVKLYISCCVKRNLGFDSSSVPKLETAIASLQKLIEAKENTRWVVRDNRSFLYWARIIEPPYFDKLRKAFLFKVGDIWIEEAVDRVNKGSWPPRLELVKVDATKRLKKGF